jgi:hypothetical protein
MLIHGTDGKWYDADCISPGVEVQRHIIDGKVVWKPITALEKRYNKAKLDFDRAAEAVADALLDAARKRRQETPRKGPGRYCARSGGRSRKENYE